MNRENSMRIKAIITVGILVCVSVVAAFVLSSLSRGTYTYEIKAFSSYDELFDFLSSNYENYSGGFYRETPMFAKSNVLESTDGGVGVEYSIDFSTTNIQVEGVDEPDIVKTDGTYLYLVANSKVYILKAYPAEEAVVQAEITMDYNPSNIFINNDRLVVFGNSNRYPIDYGEKSWWGGISTCVITIYDVSDKENPEVVKNIEIDGAYFDSRMIGDYVYAIANEYSYYIYRVSEGNHTFSIPEIKIDDVSKKIPATQIYYVDIPEMLDTMTHIVSVNLRDNEVSQKSFLLGCSQTMYVSRNNIFLAYTKYDEVFPLIEGILPHGEEKTLLHKISIKDGNISYAAQGEVPGHVLNQFSMDEYNGFFRIATTSGNVWDGGSSNNIYILDEDLNRVSEIEDIAPGEKIYSARFMGEKAYLVTFKKVDPFFTIDLSDPYDPRILGKLKIPGYSDYLHPYDEDHIIGVGKETVEPLEDEKGSWDFAWYQGLKIALFDVSDFENPREISKVVIGDRGTDSPALYDHKAFLFDKEKELLVIPVAVYEISDEIKQQHGNYTGSIYGEFTFQGAYVYKLTREGFEYKGRITHLTDEDMLKLGDYWYFGSSGSITRSLYIGDVLYTISDKMVKMNDLNTLGEINSAILR
jgi:uncharacterized secreted protein with C-terminal beta-propeller domain